MNIFNLNQIYSTFVVFLFLTSGLIAHFIFDSSSLLFLMYWNTSSCLFFIVTIFYSIFINLFSFYLSSFLSFFLSFFLSLICNISNTFFVNEFSYADMAPEIVLHSLVLFFVNLFSKKIQKFASKESK